MTKLNDNVGEITLKEFYAITSIMNLVNCHPEIVEVFEQKAMKTLVCMVDRIDGV